MNDFEHYVTYSDIADKMFRTSSEEQLASLAQVLAVHVGHFRSKFGERLVDELLPLLESGTLTASTAKVLADGFKILVGSLGILLQEADDPSPLISHYPRSARCHRGATRRP